MYVALELMDLNLQKLVQMKGAIPEVAAGKSVSGHSLENQSATVWRRVPRATCSGMPAEPAGCRMQHAACNRQQIAATVRACGLHRAVATVQWPCDAAGTTSETFGTRCGQ